MEHNISLITTLAAGFGLALILGFAAEKLRIPARVGYLFAGGSVSDMDFIPKHQIHIG